MVSGVGICNASSLAKAWDMPLLPNLNDKLDIVWVCKEMSKMNFISSVMIEFSNLLPVIIDSFVNTGLDKYFNSISLLYPSINNDCKI